MGETVQKLNERIHSYKTIFRNPSKQGHCQILYNHVTSGMCKEDRYQVQIIQKLVINGRKNRGFIEPS